MNDRDKIKEQLKNGLKELQQEISTLNEKYANDIAGCSHLDESVQIEKVNLLAIFESSPVSMMVLDEKTTVVWANKAAIILTGGNEASTLQNRLGNALGCVHILDDPRGCCYSKSCLLCPAQNGIENLLKKGGSMHGAELSLNLIRNGESQNVWLEMSAENIQINGKRHLCVALNDITSRKQVEEALAESENKFRTLFDTMSEGIIYEDHDGKIISANPAAERLLGLSLEQLQGRTSVDPRWKAIHADGSPFPGETHSLHIAAKTGKPAIDEVMGIYNPKSDAYVWLSVNSIPEFLSGDNMPFRAYAVFRDITGRRQAEEILLAAHSFRNSIELSLRSGIAVVDNEGRQIYVNPFFCELVGWTEEDLLGKIAPFVYWPPDQLPAINEAFRQTITSNAPHEGFELEFIRKDGLRFPTQIIISPFTNGNQTTGWLTNVIDITERKRAEEKLKENEIQLRELNASKDKFFSIIAHDLRGPLGAVLGLTKLMGERLSGMSPDEIQNIVSVMEKSMTNLNLLVCNLLEWSLINIGLTIFKPVSFFLLPKICEYTATIAESATKKGIIVNCDIPEELMVYADENMLGSMMRNLITNAVKFTSKGGKVNVLAQSIAGKSIQISIQDTGIGMNQKMVENLFLLNVQNGRKGTDGEPSTGLGLLLCKEFIEKHDGKIWVESEEGKGSTFYCTLPYNAEPVVKIGLHKDLPFDKVDNNDIPEVSGLKILIAEDDEISEMLLDIEVKTFCKEILKVRTGIEAVEICKNKTDIDLILMDIQMPEMRGYEATIQIRGFNKEVIIIAQTAYGFSGDREKAIEAGCNDYIAKPIAKNELLALIQKYFGK